MVGGLCYPYSKGSHIILVIMICSRCKKLKPNDKYKTCDKCRQDGKTWRDKLPRTYKQGQYTSQDGVSKTCRICKKFLKLTNFYKHKKLLDGYRNECIKCHSNGWKQYYNNGYNEVLKEKLAKNDIFRRTQNLKSLIHYHLKTAGMVKSDKTLKYVGCNKQKLEKWFNYQNNHWHYKIYHIDHILPISLFDLTNPEEEAIALHWTNLQPLFATENNSKYNKIREIEYYNKLIQVFRFDELSVKDLLILKKRHIWFKSYCNTSKLQETP